MVRTGADPGIQALLVELHDDAQLAILHCQVLVAAYEAAPVHHWQHRSDLSP
jgi:hypothetical protein